MYSLAITIACTSGSLLFSNKLVIMNGYTKTGVLCYFFTHLMKLLNPLVMLKYIRAPKVEYIREAVAMAHFVAGPLANKMAVNQSWTKFSTFPAQTMLSRKALSWVSLIHINNINI